MKINRLEVENVKRVQAVQLEPRSTGLTVIGGKNGQGKTSVLDAILWGLGGNKYKPSEAKRQDSAGDPRIQIEMDNGLVVIREGKNASLKVIDQHGNKAGQQLLDELIGQLALDLPKFLNASAKEKAETLLQVIGVGQQLAAFDRDYEKIYNERHLVGQTYTRKKKHAEDLPFEQGVPETEVSASELIQQQQAILAKNGENQRLCQRRDELARAVQSQQVSVDSLANQLRVAQEKLTVLRADYNTASRTAASLADESTAELETSLRQIDDTNRRVRINADKQRAEQEAADLGQQVEDLTAKLETVRKQRMDLLNGANLPLPGLSIDLVGDLVYNGQKWDCMSSSEQLRIAVAIVRQLRPDCQFVLLDKTEQMDLDTLTDFGKWLVIATRVSTGGECSIIIEDGLVANVSLAAASPSVSPSVSPFDQEGF